MYYDIWGSRNRNYVTANIDDLITISFYFINHEVYIDEYCIKPFHVKGVDYWCIVGCTNADDKGVILDYQTDKKLKDFNSYYHYKIDDYNQRPFKIIRFIGLNGLFGFSLLDFYGKAVPSPRNVLSQEDIDKKYFLPKNVKRMYVGV